MVTSSDPVSFTSNEDVTPVNIAANSYSYLDQLLTIQEVKIIEFTYIQGANLVRSLIHSLVPKIVNLYIVYVSLCSIRGFPLQR